jgi:hypothetical protein
VLSTLIHAGSKQGKTTVASTSPTPHLALDAEGGWKFIDEAGFKTGKKLRRIRWNPATEAIPQYDGTWDLCSVTVRSWATMTLVYQHLTQRDHQFRSVTWDSITEVQRTCRDALKGTEAMQLQDWGVLLIQMDDMIRKFRNLTLDPDMVDVCGYLTTQWGMDEAGQPTVRQPVLNIAPSDYWEAGERVQGRLPNSILLPNITDILNAVYPNAVK